MKHRTEAPWIKSENTNFLYRLKVYHEARPWIVE